MIQVLGLLQLAIYILSLIIIAQAILSWLIAFNVINTYNDTTRAIYRTLNAITDPIYRPIRRIMPDLGGLDLSPLIVLLLLQLLANRILPAIMLS